MLTVGRADSAMIHGRGDDIHGFFSVPFLPWTYNMGVEQTTPAASGKNYINHRSSLLGRRIADRFAKNAPLNGCPKTPESAHACPRSALANKCPRTPPGCGVR